MTFYLFSKLFVLGSMNIDTMNRRFMFMLTYIFEILNTYESTRYEPNKWTWIVTLTLDLIHMEIG